MPDLSPMTADLSPATPDLSTAAPPDMAGPKVCAFDDDSFENGCLLAP
jgi:hypothetical protein